MSSKCNNFLPSLYRMCNNDTDDHRECITWAGDGTSFWVSNIEQFARDILPIYYKHNNYASFVRQLNMYGFHRSTEPKGKVEPGVQMIEHFTQEYFRRGREDLLSHIHRKTSKLAGKVKSEGKPKSPAAAEERRDRSERDQQVEQMQQDIEILKKNQMQLAQTVQGMHQALVALQQHSVEQSELVAIITAEIGTGVKPEVTPVDPFAQLGFGLFNRQRSNSRPQAPPIQGGTSLIELAQSSGDHDVTMDGDLDGMLGDMTFVQEMQAQTAGYFQ